MTLRWLCSGATDLSADSMYGQHAYPYLRSAQANLPLHLEVWDVPALHLAALNYESTYSLPEVLPLLVIRLYCGLTFISKKSQRVKVVT